MYPGRSRRHRVQCYWFLVRADATTMDVGRVRTGSVTVALSTRVIYLYIKSTAEAAAGCRLQLQHLLHS